MPFKDDYDFDLLTNEAKNLVIQELEKQLNEDSKICKCQECVLDMATLALNNLQPKYRSSFTGIIYAQQYHSGNYREDVVKSVKNAIKKVKINPSHEIEK